MSIQGNIAPRIIQSISGLYTDSNRVLLEFIDNSIDNAEQYFNFSNNKYSRPIEIKLEILGNNYKDGFVTITDSCEGITDLEKIVMDFGNSRKRGQAETNGEFGFGMCSFLACCEKLEILTKTKKDYAEKITILKEHFNVDKHEDFLFSNIEKVKSFPYKSGTIIKLSGFSKNSWKDLNIDFIKNEIEKHFEMLLNRINLEIKLKDKNKEYLCQPFDYSIHEGKELDELVYEIPGLSQKIEKPIHIFLKVIKGKDLNKRPVFIIKGRRINEINAIKEFKSDFKNDIWNHPNITGYVDLIDYIKPNISRLGFRPESKEEIKALFDILISKEQQILDLIKDTNEETQEKHYQQLEDILSKALSKIARIDAMNFRTEYFTGNDIKLQDGAVGVGDSIFPPLSTNPNKPNSGIKDDEIRGDNPNDELGGNKNLNKEVDNPFDDKEPQGSERKKSGFNIKISDLEPNIDSDTGKQIKSRLLGNTIEIFRKHPEFENRVEHFRGGEPKISQRLITYLAGEITVHYKDKYYMKSGQPAYDKKMFASLVESIYLFEDLLKDAVGKNLSSWNS
jgi:hypothetical protein